MRTGWKDWKYEAVCDEEGRWRVYNNQTGEYALKGAYTENEETARERAREGNRRWLHGLLYTL